MTDPRGKFASSASHDKVCGKSKLCTAGHALLSSGRSRGGRNVSKAVRWLVVASCCCLAIAFAVAGWLHFKKPTVLTVAVGPAEFDDAALMAALSHRLVAAASPVRISIVPTSGPVEA